MSCASSGRRRKRSSQRRETFTARRSPACELREEAHVALIEQPDVGHAVAQHRDAGRPHAEREAGVALRVDAALLEHARMHHAAAENLHPAGALAGTAAGAMTELALHVHLRRRLGEREERGAEAHRGGRREEAARKVSQRRLEVDEGDALVDGESLDLFERRGVRRIERVAAIDHARHDHANRRLGCVHDADLHRRRMRAQQQAPGTLLLGRGRHVEVEGVVQVHRRVIGGEVEREEVVPVGLDLGTQGDGEAQGAEDLRDLLDDRGDGMHGADPASARGHA